MGDPKSKIEVELEILEPEAIEVKRGDQVILVREAPWEAAVRVMQSIFPLGKDAVELAARLSLLWSRIKEGVIDASVIDRELLERLCNEAPTAVRELVCGSCFIKGTDGDEALTAEEFGKLPYHAVPILLAHAVRINYIDNEQAKRFFTRLLTTLPTVEATTAESDTEKASHSSG